MWPILTWGQISMSAGLFTLRKNLCYNCPFAFPRGLPILPMTGQASTWTVSDSEVLRPVRDFRLTRDPGKIYASAWELSRAMVLHLHPAGYLEGLWEAWR